MTPELEDYILQHIAAEPELLRRLHRDTNIHLLNGRMCSGHLQGRLLKMLVQLAAPRRALELGTFSGYSALCIAEGLPAGGTLTTIEANDELEGRLRRWISQSPFASRIRLIIGDAMDVARSFPDGHFDLVFVDADKRQYCDYYRESMRLLRPGGLIIADNTLWDGHVVEDGTHAPQTQGILDFNNLVAADPASECVIIPLRDGLSLIRKNDSGPSLVNK